MWLLSLLWVEKGKGRRHLGLTWNRGQLMIQFREASFPYRLAWAFLLQRLRSFPTDTTHHPVTLARCPVLPVRPVVSRHAWLGRCSITCFSCVTRVPQYVHTASVPPLLCIRNMIMQHAAGAIWV